MRRFVFLFVVVLLCFALSLNSFAYSDDVYINLVQVPYAITIDDISVVRFAGSTGYYSAGAGNNRTISRMRCVFRNPFYGLGDPYGTCSISMNAVVPLVTASGQVPVVPSSLIYGYASGYTGSIYESVPVSPSYSQGAHHVALGVSGSSFPIRTNYLFIVFDYYFDTSSTVKLYTDIDPSMSSTINCVYDDSFLQTYYNSIITEFQGVDADLVQLKSKVNSISDTLSGSALDDISRIYELLVYQPVNSSDSGNRIQDIRTSLASVDLKLDNLASILSELQNIGVDVSTLVSGMNTLNNRLLNFRSDFSSFVRSWNTAISGLQSSFDDANTWLEKIEAHLAAIEQAASQLAEASTQSQVDSLTDNFSSGADEFSDSSTSAVASVNVLSRSVSSGTVGLMGNLFTAFDVASGNRLSIYATALVFAISAGWLIRRLSH